VINLEPASWGNPKRLAERIRANVTSGVAESREIRSNVEWQLSPRTGLADFYQRFDFKLFKDVARVWAPPR
jgi:hypothetical protein